MVVVKIAKAINKFGKGRSRSEIASVQACSCQILCFSLILRLRTQRIICGKLKYQYVTSFNNLNNFHVQKGYDQSFYFLFNYKLGLKDLVI